MVTRAHSTIGNCINILVAGFEKQLFGPDAREFLGHLEQVKGVDVEKLKSWLPQAAE